MDSLLQEWLDLVVRWVHVITGIAWIGSSFFFMWLDSHLEKPAAPRKGIEGELWMTHSGGFYRVEKIKVAPDELPRTLHWFKWEAAFTWISGVALLAIVYYLGSGLDFLDARLAGLGSVGVMVIGFAALGVAWLIYDALYMSPLAKTPFAAAVGCGLLVAAAYAFSQFMSGRAAYLHVGAIMGTIMAANVWVRIIPAQRELVAATKEGRVPDERLGAARQAALGPQQLHDAAGRVHHDQQPFLEHLGPCPQLAGAGGAGAGRCRRAALFQSAQQGHGRMVDLGGRGSCNGGAVPSGQRVMRWDA